MRTINPGNTYRGLTFPQWKALLELSITLTMVATYLKNPKLLARAEALRLKVRTTYYD
jgi:hypothetical protein